ncbi:polysaccharide biosynthesis/export family protein [Rhodocytophaga aerolata]|uniref:Polysaccharide biosynthesis/export family protein n=1 Tax=Rhodocytophaga aerolata TaxID=455078 RepID=A0ABT8R880_9BACT|nr:polysaccharide biosynthesis/export family protein [Rhodocytophaga aerolata]MDO1448306.1 polysaccharide biosynthesis/export family protein [Rhodocytophaga aerolata]
MRLKINTLHILFIFFSFTSISCIPQKNIVYFQGARNQGTLDSVPIYGSQDYEYIIGPTDILGVQIDGVDDAIFAAFKPSTLAAGGGRPIDRGLLVDKQGQIELPYLGKIKLSGLTLPQAADTIKSRLSVYITDSTFMYVNVKTLSFPVTVIGEIGSPGIYQADNEFMTITELLAKSGDMTQYSNRKTIKLYRTDRETKLTTVYQLDLTKPDLVQPILSRLQPNDVIYVEPLRRKQFQSALQVIGFGSSIASIVVLAFTIYQRF